MEEYKLSVASSPHASSPVGTKNLMRDVLIALIPALAMGIYVFGPRALTMTLVSVVFCEIFEWLYCKIMHKPIPCGDLSAAITGVLLVFVCPVTLPYWTIIIGDAFAIIVVKQLFGGLGKNFANPAIVGRVVLFLAFSGGMTNWVFPDAVSSATPLALISKGAIDQLPSLWHAFIGWEGGCLGETCSLALIAGGIYLIVRKVITWHIPVAFIGTVFVLTALLGQQPVYQVLSGGLLLGAIFMATDYVTSPPTPWGKVIFGIGCGLITVLIRVWGSYPEGVSFAILFMNILNPYITSWTRNKPIGGVNA